MVQMQKDPCQAQMLTDEGQFNADKCNVIKTLMSPHAI